MDQDDEILFCANSIYGCMKTFLVDCKKCDDIFNLYACTECNEGYKPNEYGICLEEINKYKKILSKLLT